MNPLFQEDLSLIDRLAIDRLVTDSRLVQRGDTFVAYPGHSHDGRRFIDQALGRGAQSVLWEPQSFRWSKKWTVKQLAVSQLRYKIGAIASHVYGRPSSRMWTVGVTGTNGKTTCSHWIAQAFNRLCKRSAVVGTLGNGFLSDLQAGPNTTPDAAWLQAQFCQWNRQGAQAISMEVSSHGLDQGRVNGVEFDVALLTNLTRDHLDYHGTMNEYKKAKARLFQFEGLKWKIFNCDDVLGLAWTKRHVVENKKVAVVGYGFKPIGALLGLQGYVQGSDLALTAEGFVFQVHSTWGSARVRSHLMGRFNASNLLATLSVLLVSQVPFKQAIEIVSELTAVAGRAERHGGGRQPLVLIDYAHTPDALEKILSTAKELTTTNKSARLTCVFGCGGDRDRGKRRMMGKIASHLADQVIVTSDNPRHEDAQSIIAEILSATQGASLGIEDREQAIHEAIHSAVEGDVVVVAGKGHETYQEIAGVRHGYSDQAVVEKALRGYLR